MVSNSKIIVIIVIVAIAAIAVWYLSFYTAYRETGPIVPPNVEPTGNVVELTVHGENFKFDRETITVNKGDTVKITFISDDSAHNICVEGYGCSETVSGGGSDLLEFVAGESGTLKFYCSVDGHRVFGMEGDFVIQ